jgi:Tfp pilus assembly protein PilV
MSNKKFTFNSLGISIIEVIVAISIVTIGMIGVSSLVIQNIQAQYINKNILIASGLAQEGLELVRNVRDENWLISGNSWSQDLTGDGTYAIDYRGRSSIDMAANNLNSAAARLYLDSNGLYSHQSSGTATNFYRLITVVDQTNYLDIKCAIRWKEGSANHDYTAETYLYNWR